MSFKDFYVKFIIGFLGAVVAFTMMGVLVGVPVVVAFWIRDGHIVMAIVGGIAYVFILLPLFFYFIHADEQNYKNKRQNIGGRG